MKAAFDFWEEDDQKQCDFQGNMKFSRLNLHIAKILIYNHSMIEIIPAVFFMLQSVRVVDYSLFVGIIDFMRQYTHVGII
jgi:hypothetical protein